MTHPRPRAFRAAPPRPLLADRGRLEDREPPRLVERFLLTAPPRPRLAARFLLAPPIGGIRLGVVTTDATPPLRDAFFFIAPPRPRAFARAPPDTRLLIILPPDADTVIGGPGPNLSPANAAINLSVNKARASSSYDMVYIDVEKKPKIKNYSS
jgi:hypothetical protein